MYYYSQIKNRIYFHNYGVKFTVCATRLDSVFYIGKSVSALHTELYSIFFIYLHSFEGSLLFTEERTATKITNCI